MAWRRALGAVAVAGVGGVAVAHLGRSWQRPHFLALAFAMFLFLMVVLQPSRFDMRAWWRPTGKRLVIAIVLAVVGGVVHALLLGT
ncbi:hypothetical protein BH09GEM1_BH09GEM1_42920 [soil metagenome]